MNRHATYLQQVMIIIICHPPLPVRMLLICFKYKMTHSLQVAKYTRGLLYNIGYSDTEIRIGNCMSSIRMQQ